MNLPYSKSKSGFAQFQNHQNSSHLKLSAQEQEDFMELLVKTESGDLETDILRPKEKEMKALEK